MARSEINLRRDKDSPLTIEELDNNFDFLDSTTLRIEELTQLNTSNISTLLVRVDEVESAIDFDANFSSLINIPTTLEGYGITDAATLEQGALSDTALQPGDPIPFASISNTPSTITGYGITDAASQQYVNAIEEQVSDLLNRIVVVEDRLGINSQPRITVTSSVNQVSETVDETTNKVVTFTINATDFLPADAHSYTINGTNITEDDFVDTPLNGVIGEANGTFNVTVTIARDETTEDQTEIMSFGVNTTSSNPNTILPAPLAVEINDTSYNSELRTVNYNPEIDGDLFTWLKTNQLTAYVTDISDGYLITDAERDQAIVDAKSDLSRENLARLGFTNAQIEDFIEEVIAEMTTYINTTIGSFFQNMTFTTHAGNFSYGTEQEDPELGTFIIDAINSNKKYVKGSLAHSSVTYVESISQAEAVAALDDYLETDATYQSLDPVAQEDLRAFLFLAIDFAIALLPGTSTTIGLYNYRVANELS